MTRTSCSFASLPMTPATPSEAAFLSQTHAGELLTTPHLHRKWVTTETLGRLGSYVGDEGVAALSKTLTHKESQGCLRWQSAKAIGAIGPHAGQKSAASLAQVLLQRKPGQPGADVYVRCGIASSIAKLGEAARGPGVFALSKALETEKVTSVRQRAASALGQLGAVAGELGVQSLVSALEKDEEVVVRCRCAEALGGASMSRVFGPKADGVAALATALATDKVDGVRWRAAQSLGALGDAAGEVGTAALLQASEKDNSLVVRSQCVEALEEIGKASAKVLRSRSTQLHSFVRGRAAKLLGSLGKGLPKSSLDLLLVTLLNDPDTHVRRRAGEALRDLGTLAGDIGVAALARAHLQDSDVYVDWVSSEALGDSSLGPVAKPSEESNAELDRLLEEDLARRAGPDEPEKPVVVDDDDGRDNEDDDGDGDDESVVPLPPKDRSRSEVLSEAAVLKAIQSRSSVTMGPATTIKFNMDVEYDDEVVADNDDDT